MRMYKVANPEGKFSTGGVRPSFNSKGKMWSLAHLKSHIKLVLEYRNGEIYNNCKIVEFELLNKGETKFEDFLWQLK